MSTSDYMPPPRNPLPFIADAASARTIIIGLAGKKRTGKSTCANYLCEHHGFTQYAFADPIKRMLTGMGLRDYELEERKEHPLYRLGITARPRNLMQSLGTQWGLDHVDPDIWLKLADVYLRENPSAQRLVISDIRFENEARWVRERGGIVVHILRNTETYDHHSSEKGINVKPGEPIIYNYGTLAQLTQQITGIAKNRGA